MTPEIRFALEDMVENARLARGFLGESSVADVRADVQQFYALARAVEIIGEAANRVPKSIQATITDVPWSKAIGMRNVIVHGYRELDLEIVVDTVRNDMPLLIETIEKILKDAP